jgi:T5SS/PEP-CTERM-associated repeat protein
LSIFGGARVQSQSSAVIGFAATAGTVLISGEGSIWNTGSLDIGPNGRLDIESGASVISSQETIIDPSGRLRLEGGTFDTQDLTLENSVQFEWAFGTLRVGTCHGNLANLSGILASGHPAGSTTILGNYTQQSAGILEMEIGGAAQGTQYDLINVIGDTQLGGQLDLKLISGFVPTPSQTFVIFRADTVAGAFDNVANGQRLPADGGGSFQVHYGPGSAFAPDLVVLSAFHAGLAGDFNSDGNVDAADYVVWRKSGINGPTGYDTWRTHFGEPGGNGSVANANATVPEPTTVVMLMFAAAAWCLRRRRAE